MYRQYTKSRHAQNLVETPKSRKSGENDDFFGEKTRKLAIFCLCLSTLVLVTKVGTIHHETIEKAILERKLVSYEVLTEDGRVMLINSWETAVKYSRFWLPLLCGFLITYVTWMIVYLDSDVPGVHPPSPFSPRKYRVQSGHTFHLNYVFAILVGIMTTFYMYFRGASIQY